ncbi:MAG: hypothetical protein GXP62_21145 [Oligoflexia bacterium]|nr:hypothetical protein [Oligoflexia bacterium]
MAAPCCSGLAAAALKHLAGDALIAVVGLCFVASWVATGLDASPLLTFLTAGALLNNATGQGKLFKAVATRLSHPVYVLFFTLVGADLHVDAITTMAPFALAIVVLRLGGYLAAARLSARLVPLPDSVRRYAFLGLAPQAGIALTIALAVGHDFDGWGMDFETLGLAAIALNEMIGPVLLKWSLSLSGEAGEIDREAAAAAATATAMLDPETEEAARAPQQPVPPTRMAQWLPEPGRPDFDPWGGAPRTGDRRLDEQCRELQRDLDAMVRDLRYGVVARRRESALSFSQLLRKEFLRSHRRATLQAADPNVSDEDLWTALALQRGELADHWKALLLDRAASVDFRTEHKAIAALFESVERCCQALPAALTAPLLPEHIAPRDTDTAWVRARRTLARVWMFLRRLVGDTPLRIIEPRAIARFVLVGQIPIYLRDAVGVMILEEHFILARTRNLFEAFDHTLDQVIETAQAQAQAQAQGPPQPDKHRDAPPVVDTARRVELLGHLREELEEEFHLLTQAIDRFSDEIVRVSAAALGRAYREYAELLTVAGTPALVARDYRFSRIYEASGRATAAIFDGLDSASQHTGGSAAALAMELDVIRLTEQVRGETLGIAQEAARDVRGRMSLQLGRVQDAMDEAVVRVGQLLHEAPTDPEIVLNAVEALLLPVSRVVDEVVGIAQQYRGTVRAQPPFETLMVTLTGAVDGLTDRYQVVFDPGGPTGRGIPVPPPLVDIAFRDLVRAFIESETGRELSDLAKQLQDRVDSFARGIEDIDRMLVFHAELARAELGTGNTAANADDSMQALEQSLAATLRRLARRAQELQTQTDQLADEVQSSVHTAVLGNLDRLRNVLVSGQVAEIRARLAQRTLAQGRRELASAATRAASLAGRILHVARATLGEDALHEARKIMGLPNAEDRRGPAFAPPQERVEIPIAYRRLFSDRALEAGDMLAGREDEVSRLRRVLIGEGPGSSRAVAGVGVSGMGKGAVQQALIRGLGDRARIHRFELEAPGLDAQLVEEMITIARLAAAHARPTIITVDGFRWLFDIRPGGFDLLRRFVAGVVATSSQVGWLVAAERPVWAYADRPVPLHDAFPERMDLEALNPAGMRRAILSRHAMSGYKLQFRRPEDSFPWWIRDALNPRARELALFEQHYFNALHRDSGGVLGDALRLWMASITAIDSNTDTAWLGSPPPPPVRALRDLPDDLIITLRQVARSGRITAENHAIQFQLPVEKSRALLARLTHWGLLRRNEHDAYCFREELAGAIYRILRERRLVG